MSSVDVESNLLVDSKLEPRTGAFWVKLGVAVLLSVVMVALGLSSRPLQTDAVSSTMEMKAKVQALFCSFQYENGMSRYVPPGCVLISKNDLQWSELSGRTPSLYVCAKASFSPVDILSKRLDFYHQVKPDGTSDVSYVKPGEGVKATIYSKTKLQGDSHEYEADSAKTLTHADYYRGKDLENDNVLSIHLEMSNDEMFAKCSDVHHAVKDSKLMD